MKVKLQPYLEHHIDMCILVNTMILALFCLKFILIFLILSPVNSSNTHYIKVFCICNEIKKKTSPYQLVSGDQLPLEGVCR